MSVYVQADVFLPELLSNMESRVARAIYKAQQKLERLETSVEEMKTRDSMLEYDAVANRPIKDLEKEPQFANCTSTARLVANHLDDAYIVAGVDVDEHKKICIRSGDKWTPTPSRWKEVLAKRNATASGHDVVLMRRKCSDEWYYFNLRDKISEIQLVQSDLKPDQLKKKIKEEPVNLPYKLLKAQGQRLEKKLGSDPYKGGISIFSVHRAGNTHSYQERLNMIARGDPTNPVCRYDLGAPVPMIIDPMGNSTGAQ